VGKIGHFVNRHFGDNRRAGGKDFQAALFSAGSLKKNIRPTLPKP
jgi:hypothetical protein